MYECHNSTCTLGTAGNPGRFSGGIMKEQVTLLTGNQEPEDGTYGEGFCPNCGKEGEKI